MIKVGVIGVGSMGKHHPRIYSELDNVELIGIVDKDRKKARKIGKKYETKLYNNYEDLYEKIDAVSIAVPTPLHSEVALDFIQEGIHCFVEKPIASTIPQAKEMIKQARKNRIKLMVGHIERFNPAVTKLKEIIEEDVLGKILFITIRRVGPYNPRIKDTGIIVDYATHDIDVAQYITGKFPKEVYSKTGSVRHKKEDHAFIVLDFGDSASSIEVNWFTPHKVRTLVATGTEGIAYLDYIDQSLEILKPEKKIIPKFEKEEPLKIELSHFVDYIKNGNKPLIDGKEGLKVLKTAKRAQASGKSNKD